MKADPGFKPGDPPPLGYLAWHTWADVQAQAGLAQVRCARCRLYQFPQELDAAATAAAGKPICRHCTLAERGRRLGAAGGRERAGGLR